MDGALPSVSEVTTTRARRASSLAACAEAGLLGAVASGTAQVGGRHLDAKDGVIRGQLKYCVAILLHNAAPCGPRVT